MTSDLNIFDRLSVMEKTIEEMRNVVNSISNDKVPRITMRRLNEALGDGVYLSTQTSEEIDDEEISDVEAAIYDAKQFSESANQDTRRMKSAMETHRFILVKLLKHLDAETVLNILKETEGYALSFPESSNSAGGMRAGSRLSGLELRAYNKELDAIRSLLTP
ncbi:hypothetical protein NKW54_12935 [Acetobacter cerevisiae]|uniref:Uncharacterized protein n=1 Tax=Acetobacter cerevisiae TaxID=178900 RepID=A0ABT1ETX1_9PROT|nr:hypothetical protein [Acetobacter cerevisiae]MCP1246836.1 hypothetical protein [Acetobacter cerevisiae]MCP1256899.1 hypothetical protein [Acetobacter cerevisiae]